MIRKIVLVAVVVLCLVAALMVSASLKASPPAAKYLGYWRAAEESQTGGPRLMRIADDEGAITVTGLPEIGEYYEVADSNPTTLTLEAATDKVGSFVHIIFDTDGKRTAMRVTVVPVEDAGTVGVPAATFDFTPATESADQLAAELAAQVARQNRPPEVVIEENAHIIAAAIESWAAHHKGRFPPLRQVLVGAGIASYIKDGNWPINPQTGEPMQYRSEVGDYSYATDGTSYTLSVNMPDGSTLTLP